MSHLPPADNYSSEAGFADDQQIKLQESHEQQAELKVSRQGSAMMLSIPEDSSLVSLATEPARSRPASSTGADHDEASAADGQSVPGLLSHLDFGE